jgi:predicted naringenin-chalcone synthase
MNASDACTRIAAVACTAPPCVIDQKRGLDFMKRNYEGRISTRSMAISEKLFSHPSIERRHFAFERPEELLDEDPDRRMDRFTHWSVALSAQAARRAMAEAGVSVGDVTCLVVNTCTGYICPGVSTYLVEELGLPRSTRAYDLVGSGCGGAVPNLQLCDGLLSADGDSIVLSISVEICSATYQMGDDPSLIVSNAIFGDAAAAAVLWRRPQGLEMVDSASVHSPEYREDIRYVYRNGQLHNQLSVSLPRKSAGVVAELVRGLLGSHGLAVSDVPHWALHAGGAKVIDCVRDGLGLEEKQLEATRGILANYGNVSSATVWLILDDLLRNGLARGDWCIMVAFGAGLSAHAYLLRA